MGDYRRLTMFQGCSSAQVTGLGQLPGLGRHGPAQKLVVVTDESHRPDSTMMMFEQREHLKVSGHHDN